MPPRLDGAAAVAADWSSQRSTAPRIALAALLSALIALAAALALAGPLQLERLVGYGGAGAPAAARFAGAEDAGTATLPALVGVSSDAAGSAIDKATYASPALGAGGEFYVYLPPGYASTTARYPVLYLLHGNSQPATAFLQVGLQGELDRLIAAHEIRPLIAVMIQGGAGANNWRDQGRRGYESYVLEVQRMVDRMLPTIAERAGRAIAGDSMGGYGAMNITLGNPYRFGVVESWLGFFNGLGGELQSARPAISRLGLHAFLYGGAEDRIADPAENEPFAAELRAAGASAHGIVYPGEHSLETIEAHLGSMLRYAGLALGAGVARAQAQAHAQQARAAAAAHPGRAKGARAPA
jgi:enterochelin esterase-like enzyme